MHTASSSNASKIKMQSVHISLFTNVESYLLFMLNHCRQKVNSQAGSSMIPTQIAGCDMKNTATILSLSASVIQYFRPFQLRGPFSSGEWVTAVRWDHFLWWNYIHFYIYCYIGTLSLSFVRIVWWEDWVPGATTVCKREKHANVKPIHAEPWTNKKLLY